MKAVLALVLVFLACGVFAQQEFVSLDVNNGPGPLPRDSIAAVAFDDGIYTFGGFTENLDVNNGRPNIFFNDIWRFNTNSRRWQQRNPLPDSTTGTFPEKRAYSIAGRYGDEFIVGFGINYTADFTVVKAFNDLWGYNTVTNRWRQIRADGNTGGPGARAEVSAVVTGGKIYLFGGATQFFTSKGDTWVYTFSSNIWTQIDTPVQPNARYGAYTALDKDNGRMIIYGGERTDFSSGYPEFLFGGPGVWAFDFDSLAWRQFNPLYSLSDRNNGNGAVYYNNKFFLFGGDIGGGNDCSNAFFKQNNVNETWVWDANTNIWTQLCPATAPKNLKRATSVLVDGALFMFGGFAYPQECGDFYFGTEVWRYSLAGCYGGKPCNSATA